MKRATVTVTNKNTSSNKNSNSNWGKSPSFEEVMLADEDNLGNNQVTLKTISSLLEPLNKFIRTLQADIRELKKHSTAQAEQYSQLKAAVSKVLANSVLSDDDWNRLKKALQRHWKNDKSIKAQQLKEIIQSELDLDPTNPENEQFFKVAMAKGKDYIRSTLYRSFVRRVMPAVQNYFDGNPEIDPDDLGTHVDRIVQVGRWTKQNPTDSDKQLAATIIQKTIKRRLDANEDDSASQHEEEELHVSKKRRVLQVEEAEVSGDSSELESKEQP